MLNKTLNTKIMSTIPLISSIKYPIQDSEMGTDYILPKAEDDNNVSKKESDKMVSQILGMTVNELEPDDDTTDYCSNIPLAPGTIVRYAEKGTQYEVVKFLSKGSFANTYLVTNPENELLVLKEFYPKGTNRCNNGTLPIGTSVPDSYVVERMLDKFKKEPERIFSHFLTGGEQATCINDDMSFDEAMLAARKEVGKGGSFIWNGKIFSTYTPKEKNELNLVLPRTQCFECFGNHYYVMERGEGMTLHKYMEVKEGHIDPNLILKIMQQLTIAVCNIHRMQLIHQDLSPKNITLNVDENGEVHLKIIDLGLVVSLKNVTKENGKKVSFLKGGTIGFNDVFYNGHIYNDCLDQYYLVDIYSLGAILYYMMFFKDAYKWDDSKQMMFASEIQKMHTPEKTDSVLLEIEKTSEDNERNKMLMYECYKLAKDATACTTDDFSNRIQSADEFLNRIQEIRKTFES